MQTKNRLLFGILIIACVLLLRLPAIHVPIERDEGAYALIGSYLFSKLPYVDYFDHKPPVVYLIYKFIDIFGDHSIEKINLFAVF